MSDQENPGSEAPSESLRLAGQLTDLLVDYNRQLSESGVPPEAVRPIVHELTSEVFDETADDAQRRERLRANDEQLYGALKSLEGSEILRQAGIPVEVSEAVVLTDELADGSGLRRLVTKLGGVGGILENVYLDHNDVPTEYRVQLWVPGAAVEEYLRRALSSRS